jgi:hypothetical protein
MIGVAKIISTSLVAGRRLVKILFRGKLINGRGDIRTPVQAAPFGFDSNPTEGKRVLYAKSGRDGKYYVIGVLNTELLAEIGETRLFSTDSEGANKFNLWLRASGEALIGTSNAPDDYTNFMVKYNELATEFNKLKTDFNDLVTKYNAHTHVTTCPAGAGTAAVTTATDSPNTSDITQCKHQKIKTM